jgi:hypothetical protein
LEILSGESEERAKMEACEECLEIGARPRIEETQNSESMQEVENEAVNHPKNEWGKEAQNEAENAAKQRPERDNLWQRRLSDSRPCFRKQTLTFTDDGSYSVGRT